MDTQPRKRNDQGFSTRKTNVTILESVNASQHHQPADERPCRPSTLLHRAKPRRPRQIYLLVQLAAETLLVPHSPDELLDVAVLVAGQLCQPRLRLLEMQPPPAHLVRENKATIKPTKQITNDKNKQVTSAEQNWFSGARMIAIDPRHDESRAPSSLRLLCLLPELLDHIRRHTRRKRVGCLYLTSADSLTPPSSCFSRCAFSSAMAAL